LLTKLLAKIKMLASTVQFSRNGRPPTTTRRLPHPPHTHHRHESRQNGSSTVESPETAADSHSLRTQQRAKRPNPHHVVPSPPPEGELKSTGHTKTRTPTNRCSTHELPLEDRRLDKGLDTPTTRPDRPARRPARPNPTDATPRCSLERR